MVFDGTSCGLCGKTVLNVEEKQAAGKSFHAKCFKCVTCGLALTKDTVSDHEGELFCLSCINYRCGWCGKSVPEEEEMLAAGKKWHKLCFNCERCRKLLDSKTVAEADEAGEIYCKACYDRRSIPPKLGWGGGRRSCGSCGKSVYTPEEIKTYLDLDYLIFYQPMLDRFGNKCSNKEIKMDSATKGGKSDICCKQCQGRKVGA